jgi:hypothetical protein
MVRPGPRTPPQRWASLIQRSLEDEVARSSEGGNGTAADGRDASDLLDLIAKAASEVEHHRDSVVSMRSQFHALHLAATAWQRPAKVGVTPDTAMADGALPAGGGISPGLDIRK